MIFNRKIFSKLIFALSVLVGLVSCDFYKTEFNRTPDNGLELNSIVLDKTRIELTGCRGKTQTTLNAVPIPEYASDTEIHWTSSNEEIVSLSNKTGRSVNCILMGKGTAIISAKSTSGLVEAKCEISCSLETKSPAEIRIASILPDPHGNNVSFTWEDAMNYDDDIEGVIISAYKGNSESDISLGNYVGEVEVPYGTEKAWVKNLSQNTSYVFKFQNVDFNGNVSKGVTCAANTITLDTEKPEAISNLEVVSQGESASLSWTASSSDDVMYYLVESYGMSENAADVEDFISYDTSCVIDGYSESSKYKLLVFAVDYDFNKSTQASIDFITQKVATKINVVPNKSLALNVTWKDPSGENLKLKVKAVNGSTEVSTVVNSGIEFACLTGLAPNIDWTISITTIQDDVEIATSSEIIARTKVYKIQMYNTYSNGTSTVVPNYTNSYNHGNIVSPTNISGFKYCYWIVTPSLSNPADENQVSLMATDESNSLTNYYFCINNKKAFPSGQYNSGMGGYNGNEYNAFAISKEDILSDMGSLDYASLSFYDSGVSSTMQSGAQGWYCVTIGPDMEKPFYLYDTYLCLSGVSSPNTSNGDYAFSVKVIE